MTRATYDWQAQALYVYTDIEDMQVTRTVAGGSKHPAIEAIDLNAAGEVVGYEFLGVEVFDVLSYESEGE